MEFSLNEYEISEGREDFSFFASVDLNRELLIKTIENCVNDRSWPMSYYSLRDDLLPAIMGESASKYFFWFLFGGYLQESDSIEEDCYILLNFIMINYSLKFIRAKKYNVNPLGFDSVALTYSADKERNVNVFIKRNDDNQFMLRTNPNEITSLLRDITEYFSGLMLNEKMSYDEEKKEILNNLDEVEKNIQSIKDSIKDE